MFHDNNEYAKKLDTKDQTMCWYTHHTAFVKTTCLQRLMESIGILEDKGFKLRGTIETIPSGRDGIHLATLVKE